MHPLDLAPLADNVFRLLTLSSHSLVLLFAEILPDIAHRGWTTSKGLAHARRLLEPQVAAAAAARRVKDDITLLRKRVAEGREARGRAGCDRADDAFHQSIAQVARNPLLIAFLRHYSSARCRAVWQREWDRTYRRVGVEEFTRVHDDHHEQVGDAIAAGDGTAAHHAMAHHLEAVSIDMGVLSSMPSR
ncbi:MAG: FadR/GntR family transcriptional regulator [Salipiger thiooxidans]|uniref:FadR/GntR family transcriptional regulator n=1 Tax=Salipiger thiooxidans TaxID=282683 RepID=UPI001CF9AF14|nr:FCD domain-containing protein [Salipiger thiooxidans]